MLVIIIISILTTHLNIESIKDSAFFFTFQKNGVKLNKSATCPHH